MAETFNCPRCGAPLDYDYEKQGEDFTVNCHYCGETVIVPEDLRPRSPVVKQIVYRTTVRSDDDSTGPRKLNRKVDSCISALIIGVVVIVLIITIVPGFLVRDAAQTVLGIVAEAQPTEAPTPTDPVAAVQTQIAPIMEQVTKAVGDARKAAATQTPKPTTDYTATAEAETTITAQAAQVDQQKNWPVVLQEKFANASRNWTTGIDNNDLAYEERSIAGNKYTWKMTSKKSMASFSFPDMPAVMDLYISVDLQMSTNSPNAANQAGIVFCHSEDEKSFYFFGVNPLGTYSLSFYDGSDLGDLIPVTETNLLKSNQVNHLAVSMQGSQIFLIINDKIVATFEDMRGTSGVAGLGTHLPGKGEDATLIFTNFTVRAPKK